MIQPHGFVYLVRETLSMKSHRKTKPTVAAQRSFTAPNRNISSHSPNEKSSDVVWALNRSTMRSAKPTAAVSSASLM